MKRTLFAAVALGISLILAEVLLQVACLVSTPVSVLLSPESKHPRHDQDPVLGLRPNPDHPAHDAWGFRNAAVPAQADLVILGDSQAYGLGVPVDRTWPQVAAQTAGLSVYCMAYPGYGPGQSLELLDRALSLRPRVVVAAFYSGNDLFDVYAMAYERQQLQAVARLTAETQNRVDRAEAEAPLRERVQGQNPFRNTKSGPRRWVADHSRLYGLARALSRMGGVRRNWGRLRDTALASGGAQLVYETENARTILTPRYRLTALDRDDIRIREGERIALACLQEMANRCREAGVQFLVATIPTKELVFAASASAGLTAPSSDLDLLVRHETKLWQATRDTLRSSDIELLECLPALRASLHAGVSPYWIDVDGHPNESGHRVIGEAVGAALRTPSQVP